MNIRAKLTAWANGHAARIMAERKPDFIVGGAERPYLLRWWVIPRNRFFNLYLHLFLRSDDDRALHDHPWLFNASWLIDGHYIEHRPNGARYLEPGAFKFRWGRAIHRVELLEIANTMHELFHVKQLPPAPCTTLFFTGPVVREWGFHCPKGWVPWQRFTDSRDKGEVGAGCEG